MQQTHPSWLALKASVPASEFLDCCKALELLSATKGIACVYSAHAGNGIINFYLRGRNEGGDGEYSVGVVREARDAVLAMGGTLTLERAPVELKEKVGVWGPARSDFQLMLALKESFDPKHVLSPGRLVGGI
jgi:FAD/FMN-containing dehydrogenase